MQRAESIGWHCVLGAGEAGGGSTFHTVCVEGTGGSLIEVHVALGLLLRGCQDLESEEHLS